MGTLSRVQEGSWSDATVARGKEANRPRGSPLALAAGRPGLLAKHERCILRHLTI
jgi:hypothetical protein